MIHLFLNIYNTSLFVLFRDYFFEFVSTSSAVAGRLDLVVLAKVKQIK
jgi:hypothetical protein